MGTKKLCAFLTVSLLLSLCLTAAWATMSDKDFLNLCMRGTVQEISDELTKGANPNAKDSDGMTGLMWAAYDNPDPETITLLLKAGADVNAEDNIRHTALMWAAANNKNSDVLSVLLKAGADVNAESHDGFTPLMKAAGDNSIEVVKALLRPEVTKTLKSSPSCWRLVRTPMPRIGEVRLPLTTHERRIMRGLSKFWRLQGRPIRNKEIKVSLQFKYIQSPFVGLLLCLLHLYLSLPEKCSKSQKIGSDKL